jgi:hypothetical protein
MLLCQRYYSQPEPKADSQVDHALEYLASYAQSEELRDVAGRARQFRWAPSPCRQRRLQRATTGGTMDLPL